MVGAPLVQDFSLTVSLSTIPSWTSTLPEPMYMPRPTTDYLAAS